jgi:tRNA(Arg) A34 adenosine deaminase TadA
MNEPTSHSHHHGFLRQAIRLAKEKMRDNEGGPFGAIIVRGDEVIGRGWNRVTSTNDPTAHAEIVAIRDACAHLGIFSLKGCEIYCSCEPCPMCLSAILWARIERIHYAATSADAAAAGFDDSAIAEELRRPIEERTINMLAALRDEAAGAFTEWLSKEDRVDY